MKILIAGDYVPIGRFADCLTNENLYDFNIMKAYCDQADYSLVNFEAPITAAKAIAIRKNGPNLRVPIEAIAGIKRMGFQCVTLANNHFRDYGDEGVQTTLESLDTNGVDHVGGGRNVAEARKILYKTIGEYTIAFVNFCENEFSIATEKRGGAMPLDVVENFHQIRTARDHADRVIVIVHGGHEGYQLPSPRMKKLYRFFVEIGADVVVNHHQHCFSGYEVYQGKPIFYGLGNFIFDREGKRNCIWNEGYFIILDINSTSISFELTPYQQCDSKPGVFPLMEVDREHFMSRINKLSDIVSNDDSLKKEFEQFAKVKTREALATLSLFANRFLMALIVRGIIPSFVSKKKAAMLYNYISCEAHRDVTLKTLNNIIECD